MVRLAFNASTHQTHTPGATAAGPPRTSSILLVRHCHELLALEVATNCLTPAIGTVGREGVGDILRGTQRRRLSASAKHPSQHQCPRRRARNWGTLCSR